MSRVLCNARCDIAGDNMLRVATFTSHEAHKMHQAGPSCSAPLLAAFTSGATAVHARLFPMGHSVPRLKVQHA